MHQAFDLLTDVPAQATVVSKQLREAILRALQRQVTHRREHSSFSGSLAGVSPAVFLYIMEAFLPAGTDHLAIAAQSSTRVALTHSQLRICLGGEDEVAHSARNWFVHNSSQGRFIWIQSRERKMMHIRLMHSTVTERTSHEACPRCNFVGDEMGECVFFSHCQSHVQISRPPALPLSSKSFLFVV